MKISLNEFDNLIKMTDNVITTHQRLEDKYQRQGSDQIEGRTKQNGSTCSIGLEKNASIQFID